MLPDVLRLRKRGDTRGRFGTCDLNISQKEASGNLQSIIVFALLIEFYLFCNFQNLLRSCSQNLSERKESPIRPDREGDFGILAFYWLLRNSYEFTGIFFFLLIEEVNTWFIFENWYIFLRKKMQLVQDSIRYYR